MILGLDLLGWSAKAWKPAPTIAEFPSQFALGVFARAFGDAMPRVRLLLDSGKVSALRVQIWWDNNHKIAPLDYLKRELPRWESLARQYPHIPFFISHSCEYSETSRKEVTKRVNLVLSLCPSCTVVQTPMHSPVVAGVGLIEEHGSKAKAKGIASTDGNEICQMDAEKWVAKNSEAQIVFGWACRFNGRDAHTMAPPLARTSFPTAKYMQAIIRLMYPKGVPPSPVFDSRPPQGKELWKAMAEDQKGDPRANKPVVMLPKKYKALDIVTFDGQLVTKLPLYPDTNPHSLERYYAQDLWGYEIAEKAQKLSGSEFVWIKNGGIGPIHPAFRLGTTYQ